MSMLTTGSSVHNHLNWPGSALTVVTWFVLGDSTGWGHPLFVSEWLRHQVSKTRFPAVNSRPMNMLTFGSSNVMRMNQHRRMKN